MPVFSYVFHTVTYNHLVRLVHSARRASALLREADMPYFGAGGAASGRPPASSLAPPCPRPRTLEVAAARLPVVSPVLLFLLRLFLLVLFPLFVLACKAKLL